MYSVVFFKDSNEVEVVPRSWVNGQRCRWPAHLKGIALIKAIESRRPPEADWDTYYSVQVMKESGMIQSIILITAT